VLSSQSGNDPQEYLARFGYMLNLKVKIFKKILLIFLVTYVNHVYSNIESGEESHFFGSILCYVAKVANDPQEYLARFGYIHEPCTVIWRVEKRVFFLGQFCVM